MSMTGANPVTTLHEEDKPWKEQEESQKLDTFKVAGYRSLAARANYLASDRPDIQFATNGIVPRNEPTHGRRLERPETTWQIFSF